MQRKGRYNMGGTRDGEVYESHNEEQRKRLEELTEQLLVPLSDKEAELARLMDDKVESAKMFQEKSETNKDLENEMRNWLRRKGKV